MWIAKSKSNLGLEVFVNINMFISVKKMLLKGYSVTVILTTSFYDMNQ